MQNTISIKGARQHNLKNISLTLPKDKLIVFTGVSGSGKSSLAFDTIYAEGQRRYVESLSSYARQFLGIMDKPDVDHIDGLSPAISIDQKSTSHNPRSTVGTVTEIYDYMRLLYARTGHPHCPSCGREISKLTVDQIVTMILNTINEELETNGNKVYMFLLLSPVVRDRKGEFTGLLSNIQAKGFRMVRIDNRIVDVDEDLALIKTNKHSIDVVIDKIAVSKQLIRDEPSKAELRKRIADDVEVATALSSGLVTVGRIDDQVFTIPDKPKHITDTIYSEHFSCPTCSVSLPEIEPRTFSFNTPHGACPKCTGIGKISSVDPELVTNPELSIREGGIAPFERMFFHDTWYARLINTVCKTHGINEFIPYKNIPQKQKDILLFGTGEQVYEVFGKNRFGIDTQIEETYHGVINELKKRYQETQSEYVRTEIERYMREEICPECHGLRLKKESLTVTIDGKNISEVTAYSIRDAITFFSDLQNGGLILSAQEKTIGKPIIKEILNRLTFLVDVGLEYLTLDRRAGSLSGGEAQRIRLASQIGSGLSGVLYVLDEPSIGLHPRDNSKLIDTLKNLRDLGNTVVVVEHDRDMIISADHIVDFGPGAGDHGGAVLFEGTPEDIIHSSKSITGKYISGKQVIRRDQQKTSVPSQEKELSLVLEGAKSNNLKNITVTFPLGIFTAVTGVSGSGKSTLVVDTLYAALQKSTNPLTKVIPGTYDGLKGLEHIDKAILIDQSPIGRTPRSNPATYTGVFTYIRDLFSLLPESKARGFTSGRFSFNVKNGRCEACEGEGQKRIEMQFLSDVYVTCDVCHGKRYNAETLSVEYHGKSIADVLDMTVEEAITLFSNHPHIKDKLMTLKEVGLSYMKLGQPAPTLSGGEAQRVKLATELSKKATGKTVYILDEPTTGLHFADIEKLLHVLHRLTMTGNTVIVIEHNLDIIKNADWIIDLGPEGGDGGGYVVCAGTPKFITSQKASYTGKFLAEST